MSLFYAFIYKLILRLVFLPCTSMPRPRLRAAAGRSAQTVSQLNLTETVQYLATTIGARNIEDLHQLKAAESFIASRFKALGYAVNLHPFEFRDVSMNNVVAEQRGTNKPAEIVIIGAHYDTVSGSPGADDNASGVAAMLETARLLVGTKHSRTVRFVAFANEENEGSWTWETMGSYHYARDCKQRSERIAAMLSLEMLGFYFDGEGSQRYPEPFNLLYPSVANFIAFVGNFGARRLVRNCVREFRQCSNVPAEGLAAPSNFGDVNRSDHWGFGQLGYPSIMVTDTANYRNPFYHSADDLPHTLDYERFARVTAGVHKVVLHLLTR